MKPKSKRPLSSGRISPLPPAELPSDFDVTAFRRALLNWYRRRARDLPWRRTRDPYLIWLSEIMLQQTRVETVLSYFARFTARYPTVRALAAAEVEDVLRLWAGLGYYSRARNLHRAAQLLAAGFPDTAEGWRALPGVGRYTAAAVASIAGGQRTAVLDGNVKRVLARLFAITRPVEEAAAEEWLWNRAERLLAPRAPGDHNQAMMELGARVCVPKNPDCEPCPARHWCSAYERDLQQRLPMRRQKNAAPLIRFSAAAIECNGCYLMAKRPSAGVLAHHWHFPAVELGDKDDPKTVLQTFMHDAIHLNATIRGELGVVPHVFSHRRHEVRLFDFVARKQGVVAPGEVEYRWVPRHELHDYALTSLDRKLVALLPDKVGTTHR